MTTPEANFYLSAARIGYTSKQVKELLGWTTAKGRSQAEFSAALVYLNNIKQDEKRAAEAGR